MGNYLSWPRRSRGDDKIINYCKIYYDFHDRRACNYGTVGNISTGDEHSGEMVSNICTCQYQNKQQEEMAEYLKAWTDGMVEMAAYKKVMEMLNNGTTWITIKGSPGEGKTTVAYMALRELQKSDRKVFQARSPEEFTEITKTCSRPVILLDDLFGQLEFDETAWLKWKGVFHKVLDLKEHRSHERQPKKHDTREVTVLFVGRNYVFNPASVHMGRLYNIIVQDPCVVDMSHSVHRSVEEKQKIWDAIIAPSGITVPKESIDYIFDLEGRHGFPHVCSLFVTIHKGNSDISAEKFFKTPLEFLNETIKVFLQNKPKLKLFKEMMQKQGRISERDLEMLDPEGSMKQTAEEFLGSYLKKEDFVFGYFGFDHPSIYDSVAFNMCKHHTMFVIQNCKLPFIHERLRLKPSHDEMSVPLSNETDLVMYISQCYVIDLAKRFSVELSDSKNWFLVLSHQACTKEVFVKEMMSQLTLPLREPMHMFNNLTFYRNHSFFSLLASNQSSQLLKYIDSQTDIQLTQSNIDTVLYGVCKYAASHVLSYLLQSHRHKLDVNVRYEDGITPLMIASETRDSQFVETIMSLNPDLKAHNSFGSTALHLLCENGLVSAVSQAIDKGCDINEEDGDGDSPLYLACEYNHLDMVTLLLNRGANIDDKTLRRAIRGTNVHIFKALFDGLDRHDLPVDFYDDGTDEENKCCNMSVFPNLSYASLLSRYICMSCEYDNVEVLNILLDMGASINEMYDGRAPLHVACEQGRSKSVQCLIDHGADVNIKDEQYRTPLICTILSDYVSMECGELLLKAEADMRALVNYRSDGGTVINALVKHNGREFKERIDVLVKAGVSVNRQTDHGQTPLHVAVFHEREKFGMVDIPPPDIYVCQTLISHGADVNIQDSEGNTPLHILSRVSSNTDTCIRWFSALKPASSFKDIYKQAVKLLVEHGADVNKLNNKGQTALKGWMRELFYEEESESKSEKELF